MSSSIVRTFGVCTGAVCTSGNGSATTSCTLPNVDNVETIKATITYFISHLISSRGHFSPVLARRLGVRQGCRTVLCIYFFTKKNMPVEARNVSTAFTAVSVDVGSTGVLLSQAVPSTARYANTATRARTTSTRYAELSTSASFFTNVVK